MSKTIIDAALNAAEVIVWLGLMFGAVGTGVALVIRVGDWYLERQERQKKAASTAGTVEAKRLAG